MEDKEIMQHSRSSPERFIDRTERFIDDYYKYMNNKDSLNVYSNINNK